MSVVPKDFQTMEVFADGLRNEVGLAFDRHGALWGVENSADKLNRDDLGGDIHENNPVSSCAERRTIIYFTPPILADCLPILVLCFRLKN